MTKLYKFYKFLGSPSSTSSLLQFYGDFFSRQFAKSTSTLSVPVSLKINPQLQSHQQREFSRRSRFSQPSSPSSQAEAETDVDEASEGRRRPSQRPGQRGNEDYYEHVVQDGSQIVGPGPGRGGRGRGGHQDDGDAMSTLSSDVEFGRRRTAVRKFIEETKSTYGAPIEGGKIGGDAFLTSPYVRGAKYLTFQQGNDAVEESLRRKIDPGTTSVIMFPGQGTQYVGMCGDPTNLPRYIQVLYEIASEILGYDLLELCANGPRDKLNMTVYSQPAVLVASLAALEKLREEDPLTIENCVATAGFSIGELSALVFSGVVSFEDAIRIVKVRAEAMQLAGEITPSGMSTVLYGADSKLGYALTVAKEWCRREFGIEEPVCSVANYLFPHCKVVAGHNEALDFLEQNYKDFNLRRVKRLPVSAAFHTEIMRPAVQPMKEVLRNMNFNRPRMLVFSNVTGYRYHNSEELGRLLTKQIVKPVMWEQTLHTIYKRPKDSEYPTSFECGPGSSLSSVLKQVNNKAFMKSKAIQLVNK